MSESVKNNSDKTDVTYDYGSSNTSNTEPESETHLPSGMELVPGYTLAKIINIYEAAQARQPPLPGTEAELELAKRPLEHVALVYRGMGHGMGTYFDHLLGHFVMFNEGGSNGYERICNNDVKQTYMTKMTRKLRSMYIRRRITDGMRDTLAYDIYTLLTMDISDEDEYRALYDKCTVWPNNKDSTISLTPVRVKLLSAIGNWKSDIEDMENGSYTGTSNVNTLNMEIADATQQLKVIESSLAKKLLAIETKANAEIEAAQLEQDSHSETTSID